MGLQPDPRSCPDWPEEHQNGEAQTITVVPSTVQPDSLVDLLRASAGGAVPDGAAPLS